MNTNFIEIEVSLDDYKKITTLDEFDIERKMLQTSAAQYIRISLRPERSKREDTNIKCPKCKKTLENCTYLMMGIDKKCFDCHVCWTKAHGFKGYPRSLGNL